MHMNTLVRRDPALAALVGAIQGHDFGYSRPMPAAPAPQFSIPTMSGPVPGRFGVGFGEDYGYGYGEDDAGFGSQWGFGAPKPHAPVRHAMHPHHPPRPVAHHGPASTYARTLLLDPNRESTVKVERYSFSFSPATPLVLGTASALGTFTANPSTSIKGQRVVTNAPAAGFVTLDSLQIANVNVFVGTTEDAFTYNATAQNVVLDLPRLDPQNRATASGDYTGSLPPGFSAASNFKFVITLQGPSTLAGGYGQ